MRDAQVLVMAGGEGRRLLPLTATTPKPMLYLGDKPLLQHVVDWLRSQGLTRITLSVRYRREVIEKRFPDIPKLVETSPLGTAGALSLLDMSTSKVLVLNGDVVTNADLSILFKVMDERHAAIVVGTRTFKIEVPYGIVREQAGDVVGVSEKPILEFYLFAGICLLDMDQVEKPQGRMDMTDLVQATVEAGKRVRYHPLGGYWVDIGEHHQYLQADKDVREGRVW